MELTPNQLVEGAKILLHAANHIAEEKGFALHMSFCVNFDPAAQEAWHTLLELRDEIRDELISRT